MRIWLERNYEYGENWESACGNYFILKETNDIKGEEQVNGIVINKKNKDYIVFVGTTLGEYESETFKIGLINDFSPYVDYINREPGINFGFDTEDEADEFIEKATLWVGKYFL